MVTLKRRRERGKMEILHNTNGSWHTSSNVRTPTLYCETKNKLKYWVIHSQMSEKEREQSSKVTTLRFSEMWDIVQFRRQQTDISDRPYERVRESFSLFGISLKPKDLLQLCTSFTFSQNWPWITANVTLDCENDALYSVSTPRLKSIIAYFSFLISPDFLNSAVPFASNANLYQQWMPRLHVHQFV